jgi:hypothetical protein
MDATTLIDCIRDASESIDIEMRDSQDSYTKTITYVDCDLLIQALSRIARAEYEASL